ncbi:unnamed protein product [Leptidea sinapis]|uniref:Biogenesis of lysosome-related organelles complex 1 subunit 4 n=1 Tax=Leptidea sinapis TaxID=189913 RepID=A0A5E4QBN8_9NEOP|nr:unnamed protein product [Leptidea sinapis]
MIEEIVKDYTAYLNLDLGSNLQTIQDVIDNMITRLEELTSVLHMIKTKNNDCNKSVTQDICSYRNEVTNLSKKIKVLDQVVSRLQRNVDILEKRVEKAETDFGLSQDNKLKSIFKPFLMKNKESQSSNDTLSVPFENLPIISVMDCFEST